MNQIRALTAAIMLTALVCLTTACTENPAPEVQPVLKTTLLCEGNEGATPFTLRCTYFYLDEHNKQLEPEDTVNWTLDITLEGIAQRFYSQSTGNNFFTEIDRAGEYTLSAINSGRKANIQVSVFDPSEQTSTTITRQVPVSISSGEHEVHERVMEASPGYEIVYADIQMHKNSTRVSSRVAVDADKTSATLVVELQPKADGFKMVQAWFAGNVVLTERKISNQVPASTPVK